MAGQNCCHANQCNSKPLRVQLQIPVLLSQNVILLQIAADNNRLWGFPSICIYYGMTRRAILADISFEANSVSLTEDRDDTEAENGILISSHYSKLKNSKKYRMIFVLLL